jgi:hypothetical protein
MITYHYNFYLDGFEIKKLVNKMTGQTL